MPEDPLSQTDPLAARHSPQSFSDRVAFRLTKMLRFCADTFFAKRYGHRAVILETVAGVPGMARILNSPEYLQRMGFTQAQLENATHLVWGTGGSMVPEVEFQAYLDKGRNL